MLKHSHYRGELADGSHRVLYVVYYRFIPKHLTNYLGIHQTFDELVLSGLSGVGDGSRGGFRDSNFNPLCLVYYVFYHVFYPINSNRTIYSISNQASRTTKVHSCGLVHYSTVFSYTVRGWLLSHIELYSVYGLFLD